MSCWTRDRQCARNSTCRTAETVYVRLTLGSRRVTGLWGHSHTESVCLTINVHHAENSLVGSAQYQAEGGHLVFGLVFLPRFDCVRNLKRTLV